MASFIARVLILCKTYPSPSSKYAETSCVAGMTESGELIRLYPVPFRLVADEQQFKKWQWITARLEKARELLLHYTLSKSTEMLAFLCSTHWITAYAGMMGVLRPASSRFALK